MPTDLPKNKDPDFQAKSWEIGCEHAALTGTAAECMKMCHYPRGCCGTTCGPNSCTGGNCCDSSRSICVLACDSFLRLKEAESEPQTTPAPSTTVAPTTTAAPTATHAPYVAPETTAAPTTTPSPAITVVPTVTHGGHCTPTCSWQCVSPECERTCKPLCQQPQCETRCKKEDTSGCAVNCSQPECYAICPKIACNKIENCPMCTTHCSEAVCKLECPERHGYAYCENVCEAPVCAWQCDIPKACPHPDCHLDCEEPKDCASGGMSGSPLPPLKDGEFKVHSFRPPASIREPTRAKTSDAPGAPGYAAPGMLEKAEEVPVLVFTRTHNYLTSLPVLQSAA